MILVVPLHAAGFELVAIDMPGYGCPQVAKKQATYSYGDWVQIASDFIDFELSHDARPIVLYGLSAGGMLTYHAAAVNKKVRGTVGMTFLDQRIQQVADETARSWFMSRVGVPLTRLCDNPLTRSLSIPMWLASKMWALVNGPKALKVMLADPRPLVPGSPCTSWPPTRAINSDRARGFRHLSRPINAACRGCLDAATFQRAVPVPDQEGPRENCPAR